MTEGFEAIVAMIGAHAAGSYAAEGQIFLSNMHKNIVDGHTARGCVSQYLVFFALVLAEVIQAQWSIMLIDVIHGFIDVFIAFDRQYWAKDFFLHD